MGYVPPLFPDRSRRRTPSRPSVNDAYCEYCGLRIPNGRNECASCGAPAATLLGRGLPPGSECRTQPAPPPDFDRR